MSRHSTHKADLPGEVRIIAGQWRGSKLPVPPRAGLRPTPNRVRETLFNWLGQDLTGWRCLDAFAGSGALGFEAASRGAAEVVMLERDPQLTASLRACTQRLKASSIVVYTAQALEWMERTPAAQFNLVMLDPPFDSGLIRPALKSAVRLLAPGGYLYLEFAGAGDEQVLSATELSGCREGRAGAVCFKLMRKLHA